MKELLFCLAIVLGLYSPAILLLIVYCIRYPREAWNWVKDRLSRVQFKQDV